MKLLSRDFYRQWLESRPNLAKMGANAIWLLADKAIRLPVALFVAVWVARYLGPDGMGAIGYAIAFSGLFAAAAGLGIDGLTIRELVNAPEDRDRILGTAFFLKLAAGAVSFVATVGAIWLVRHDQDRWLVAIIAIGPLFQAFDVADYWFQSRVQSKYSVLAQNPAFLAVSASKVVLILCDAPLIAFAFAALAETAVASLSVAIAFRARVGKISAWRFAKEHATTLLRDGWPLALSAMVGMIYLRVDQVMIGEILGTKEVGIYSVAVRLAELLTLLSMVIYASTLPSIIEARRISDELFYERLQKLYNLMVFVGYAVAIPTTLFSGFIIRTLFGPEYERAAPMLTILTWSSVMMNLGIARSGFLTAMNWTRLHLASAVLAALLNIGLNLLLIPRYGGTGAAIGSLVAYWFGAHGSCLLFRPLHKTSRMMLKAIVWPNVWRERI